MHEAWDILKPLAEGKWWAYAALSELMRDFERTACALAETVILEIGVKEQHRILRKRPDGKYHAHHMEVVVVPESDEKAWKMLSDELAAVRALWRCRSYYFVAPIMCIHDGMGLRIACRALPPEGSRVIYGAGAAKMQKGAGEQLHREVCRLSELLNLKQHTAYPTPHPPLVNTKADKDAAAKYVRETDPAERAAGHEGKKKGAFTAIFGSKDERFETVFGHEVVICTTASGVRFIEMVAGLFPLETGPDMERVAAEHAAKKKARQAAATAKASKAFEQQLEKEQSDGDDDSDDETKSKSIYKRFRETAQEFFGLNNRVDYNNYSLHELQYTCRELGLKWTGSRFELIPRIQAELKKQKAVQKEQKQLNVELERRRHNRRESKRIEAERMEGLNASRPGFGLTGLRRPLRPEYVRQFEKRLNSDAAMMWELHLDSHKADRMSVEKATEHYFQCTIPQVAVELQRRFSRNQGVRAQEDILAEALSCDMLKRVCREHGVRARDFGKLYNASRLADLRQVIVTEMLARLCKSLLRTVMLEALRSCRGLSQQAVCDSVSEFMRLVFGKMNILSRNAAQLAFASRSADHQPAQSNCTGCTRDSEAFWDGLQVKLEHRFPDFKSVDTSHLVPSKQSVYHSCIVWELDGDFS